MTSEKPLHLPDDSTLPRLAEWVKQDEFKRLLAGNIQDIVNMKIEYPMRELNMACARDDMEAARKIMRKLGWNGTSFPEPNAPNHHKDSTLIYLCCWGNGGTVYLDYKTLLFLADYDPPSLLSSTPSGGSMLHATLNGKVEPVIINELLERGVNPWRKNNHGATYLDRLEEAFRIEFPDGKPLVNVQEKYADAMLSSYCAYQATIALVKNFMAAHPEAECAAREETLKRQCGAAGRWLARTMESKGEIGRTGL